MKFFIVNKKNNYSLNVKESLKKRLLFEGLQEDEENPDYVISVGGDGTLLRSLHKYEDRLDKVIIVGIHTGKLGFLCDYLSSDEEEIVRAISSNKQIVDEVSLLCLKIGNKEYYAMNEVRIESPYKTMKSEIYINEKLLENYHGNGLNFSTSLGSSGYNHSLNGPLINPNMETIIMSEVAGINHNAYRSLKSPLVLGPKDVISIKGKFFNCIVGYDNLFDTIIDDSNLDLVVYLSDKKVRLLNTKKRDYFDRLRSSFIV
ncbi:MAG: NAD(+)/NADH kinase [Bacilli bacterium]